MSEPITTTSVVRCPQCGFRAEEEMPAEACVYFYRCPGCDAILQPKPGDCCVFCSWGTVPCPPVQRAGGCC
jgi:hypothetical protein